jgi:hypothetical protein
MQNKIISVTSRCGEQILVGVESIIQVYAIEVGGMGKPIELCTKIESRGAMVTSCWVTESVADIWKMVNEVSQ